MANRLDKADSAALVKHFANLYEHSPLQVVLFDPQDMVRYANPGHCADFGMARDRPISWSDMMRHSYENRVGVAIETDDIEAWLISTKARRGKLPFRAFEADMCDGRWMYITETMDDQGWMLSVGFDITAVRASDRSLRQARDGALRAAQVDTLTGVSSRAHVLEQLDLRLSQLQSTQQPCGLVLLDLDYFKKINDTYGHTAGDEVLQRFSRLVVGTLGRDDGFGRIGGEEFLLLYPMVTAAEMEARVEGILELVRASTPLPEVPRFHHTCSAGLVMLAPGLSAIENMRNADRALYAAKGAGRDRLIWA
nr:GGDEF domain-containing protein [uncultured Rhodoferax sp.]